MLLRSYFAPSVEAALSKARRELGDDAMLVDSRPAQDKARHLGTYEVVFAVDAAAAQPAVEGAGTPGVHREEVLERSVAQLRSELHRMRDEVSRVSSLGSSFSAFQDPLLSAVYTELVSRDFAPQLAHELVTSADSIDRSVPREARIRRLRQSVAMELKDRLPAALAPLHEGISSPSAPRCIALLGAPGSGKTTTLVKLAVVLGVSKRRPVRVLSIDNLRVGASEQLRAFCSILGAHFQQFETPGEIVSALAEVDRRSLVLIDTPGMGPLESDMIAEFGRVLGARREIERNLVLSATTKADDLASMADRFSICAPSHLTFTHVDETNTKGGMVSLSVTRALPIAYLCNGQQIPDDFEVADTAKLIQLAWDWHETGPAVDMDKQAGRAAAGLG